MDTPRYLAAAFADALLYGDWTPEALCERAHRLSGTRPRWMPALARRVVAAYPEPTRIRRRELIAFLLADERFRNAIEAGKVRAVDRFSPSPIMRPVAFAAERDLPALVGAGELAEWLGLSAGELEWFADVQRRLREPAREALSHYRVRFLTKRGGAFRLIESPKPRLKAIQRRLLCELLDRVPPHDAAHGFRKGRSIRSFAQPHVGRAVVVRIDLRDFFASVRASRTLALFRTLGYPEPVAAALAGLCTTSTPRKFLRRMSDGDPACDRQALARYADPHLPQGAPTSPALANLCAYRLDVRQAALARASGAIYTRYADDLAFSGDEAFRRNASRFAIHVAAIVADEGFAVHPRKTRIMFRAARQRLAGLTVNERLNVRRDDFDRLKAILTNCVRRGPASQNREGVADFRGVLTGRVAFVASIHLERGRRLRELLNAIDWT